MGEYLSGSTLEEKYEIEMIMKTQKIAEELKDSDAYQTEDYTSGLIKESDFRNSKDIEEGYNKIENLVNKKFIEPMVERTKENKFGKNIEEIIKNIILYTQKTGKMIDIFGPNNITLFINKEGKPDYHLIDVLLPGLEERWNLNFKEDKNLDLLRHSYTYYYAIKKLAEELGLENNLTPQDLNYFKGGIFLRVIG